jgi:HMG box transcription factor 1
MPSCFRAISVLLGESWRGLPHNEREVFVHEARLLATEQKRLHPDCWKRKRSQSTPS